MSKERLPRRTSVEDNDVEVGIQTVIVKLRMCPGRVEEEGVEHDQSGLAGIEATDGHGWRVRVVPDGGIVIARYEVDVGHR